MSVEFDDDGLSSGGPRVRWSEIVEVVAYKDDLWSYDEISLGFRTGGEGPCVSASETDAGYEALLDELPRRFPGVRTDWFSEVAFPAFVINLTTLWKASTTD